MMFSSVMLVAGDLAGDPPLAHDQHAVAEADQFGQFGGDHDDADAARSRGRAGCGGSRPSRRRRRRGSARRGRSPAGRTDSILAIATFCWLPPDSDETGSWMPPRLRPSRSPSAVGLRGLLAPASIMPQRVETWSRSSAEMLAAIERSRKTPSPLRSSER